MALGAASASLVFFPRARSRRRSALAPAGAVIALGLVVLGCRPGASQQPLPECEWCGAPDAPARLSSETTIARADEPGERLIVSGTVYRADGETPAAGVLIYAYHTNADGIYAKRGDETGNGRRHGHLRGWLRTDAKGTYRIATIRPAPYPGGTEPAHIHMTVTLPGEPERYIDDIVFEGDPFLTAEHRARLRKRGGSGIVAFERGDDSIWRGTRDVVLPED